GVHGHTSRALYLVADSIIESEDRLLRVNLLMNRATPWADLDSYLPFEGKAVIRMKAATDMLLVRIPEWTDWNSVSCNVNGKSRPSQWYSPERGYLAVGSVAKGDSIEI